MVTTGGESINPQTGQRNIYRQTAADTHGKLFRMESFHPAHSPADGEHVHPFQESSFELVSGSLNLSIDGKEQLVRAGEKVVIPANVPHYFWNDSDEEAHAFQEFRPALNIEDFFDTYFALARDGKLDKDGYPSLLLLAVLMGEYDKVMRLTQPSRFIQLLVKSLAPIGRLRGYRATYP